MLAGQGELLYKLSPMITDVIDLIRARQNLAIVPQDTQIPLHQPEILLIGCVDARLNPKDDIGIPDGKALIFRNIAALVSGNTEGDLHDHVSEAAVLEFAVDVMKVKHIIVLGHTDCGGIKACLKDSLDQVSPIRQYLEPLTSVRKEVLSHGGNFDAQAKAMEQAAVRQSVINLMTYPAVINAVTEGRLDIHGWVINTATKLINEMNVETGEFSLMQQQATINDNNNNNNDTPAKKRRRMGFLSRFLSSLGLLPMYMEEASTVCLSCV